MRMSCNGCKVLRKGCSDDCTIRPCLQWIKSPDSQANATLFLAKFYGRAGLINLIEASPLHLRPATFWSLLYEACGRIVCPVYGSAGLLGSGNWAQCLAAVDAVLKGFPIGSSQMPPPLPIDARAEHVVAPPRAYDIRHVSRDAANNSNFSAELHRVRNRPRFKHPSPPITLNYMSLGRPNNRTPVQMGGFEQTGDVNSGVSRPGNGSNYKNSSKEDQESLFSVETVEGLLVKRTEPDRLQRGGVDLELTLGVAPI